jgi:hypothetical protein
LFGYRDGNANEFAFWMEPADIADRKTTDLFWVLFTQI